VVPQEVGWRMERLGGWVGVAGTEVVEVDTGGGEGGGGWEGRVEEGRGTISSEA
jgi:hypothetical protein